MSLHHLEDGRFIRNFPLGMGAVSDYSGKRHQTEIFYGFVSFLEPGTFYHCDLTSDDLTPTVTPEPLLQPLCDRCVPSAGVQEDRGERL